MAKLILTRYLYIFDEVGLSFIICLLKKHSLDECYFWISELYLSGFKDNKSTKNICEHLAIDTYILNCKNKEEIIFTITKKYNIDIKNVAYIGDDINDIKLLNIVGFSACPNDAHEDCKKNVDYICNKKGGEGCIREFTDYILQK